MRRRGYQIGLAQLQAGNVQQAKADLKEAISIEPNSTEAVLALAELNIQTGAIQPAIEDLVAFIAREPRMLQAQVLLGSAYLALARREPARQPARPAVKATRKFRSL